MAEAQPTAPKAQYSLGEVNVSLSPLERFEEFLQSRGMRNTRQRRAIADEIFSRHEHFDADELQHRLQALQSELKISRATVYRTLTELVDAGLLRKMTLNGKAVYEHDYGYPQHDHLYCERCGQLFEFHSEQLKEIRDAVGAAHDFRVTGHRLIIMGVCQSCGSRKRRDNKFDRI